MRWTMHIIQPRKAPMIALLRHAVMLLYLRGELNLNKDVSVLQLSRRCGSRCSPRYKQASVQSISGAQSSTRLRSTVCCHQSIMQCQ